MAMEFSKSPYIEMINKRLSQNKNFIASINGPTGSGKTLFGVALCQKIAAEQGTNFNVHDNMAFTFPELLKKTMLPQNQKPGTCFLFEEVGAMDSGGSSRQWQSQANQFLFSFMQTTRHRNQVLIMTTPHFEYLEKGTRMLIHSQLEMVGIDYVNKVSYAKPYLIQWNSRSGKPYFKFMRVIKDGLRFKINLMKLPKPDDETIKEYEKLKFAFTTKLNQSMLEPKKKEQQQRNGHRLVCPLCNHEWLSKGKPSKRCPNCFKTFKNGVFPKEIEVAAATEAHV